MLRISSVSAPSQLDETLGKRDNLHPCDLLHPDSE